MTRWRKGSTKQRPKRFGIYVDDAMHAALRKAAIDDRISATEYVVRLIKADLSKRGYRFPKG
jgi:hypothetical protein